MRFPLARSASPEFAGETDRLLDLFRQRGEGHGRSRFIAHAYDWLRSLTGRTLKRYPGVRRREQTDDGLQNAQMRLGRALVATTPESPRHFYDLAALRNRRGLIDPAHHPLGWQGHGAKHHTGRPNRAERIDQAGDLLEGGSVGKRRGTDPGGTPPPNATPFRTPGRKR